MVDHHGLHEKLHLFKHLCLHVLLFLQLHLLFIHVLYLLLKNVLVSLHLGFHFCICLLFTYSLGRRSCWLERWLVCTINLIVRVIKYLLVTCQGIVKVVEAHFGWIKGIFSLGHFWRIEWVISTRLVRVYLVDIHFVVFFIGDFSFNGDQVKRLLLFQWVLLINNLGNVGEPVFKVVVEVDVDFVVRPFKLTQLLILQNNFALLNPLFYFLIQRFHSVRQQLVRIWI